MQDTIGVDVSKDHLDACNAGPKDHRRFSNDAAGLKALCRWVRERGDVLVVFEASGAYHRDLERMLSRQNLPFAKVNPRQARRFAEADGQVAKTDRVDAAILARMGTALDLAPSASLPAYLSELQDLLVFRRGLIRDRTAAQTRLKTARPTLLRRLLAQRLAKIERQVASVDRAMQTIIDADPDLRARKEILVSIPGISIVSATAILVDMPELGGMNGKQAAALAGLRPCPASPADGRARNEYRAEDPPFDALSSCQPSARSSTTGRQRRGLSNSSPLESPARSLSPPSCANSSSRRTRSCEMPEDGRKSTLDHHGYSADYFAIACRTTDELTDKTTAINEMPLSGSYCA